MDNSESARRWFLRTAVAYLGTPYRWGGDDPSGFDCSGLVIECLKSVGLLDEKDDFTADGLMRRLADREVADPRSGALLFRVNPSGRAEHVAICLDTCFEIGASGGCRQTAKPTEAWRDNAYVKIRPISNPPGRRRICDPFLSYKR
jgi:hypothetical protein